MRLALAGAGWAAEVHALAAGSLAGVEVVAIASRTPARAEHLARRLGARACGYDELPAGADAVVVCSAPGHHASAARRAIEAGAAVLVEKPLCTTLADADELVQAERDGARVLYGENLVHAPAVVEALGLVHGLGALTHLELRAIQERPTWGGFLEPAWGGGALFDLGAHPVALALLAAAPARPVEVTATVEAAPGTEVDDRADVMLRFDSGLSARIEVSWRGGPMPVWDLQAAAPEAVVRLDLLPEVRLERDGLPLQLPATPDGVPERLESLGYRGQLAALTTATPAVGAAFGRAVLDVICGAYASARGGRSVHLPFDGRRDRSPHQLWR